MVIIVTSLMLAYLSNSVDLDEKPQMAKTTFKQDLMVNVSGDGKLVLLEAKRFLKIYRVFSSKNS